MAELCHNFCIRLGMLVKAWKRESSLKQGKTWLLWRRITKRLDERSLMSQKHANAIISIHLRWPATLTTTTRTIMEATPTTAAGRAATRATAARARAAPGAGSPLPTAAGPARHTATSPGKEYSGMW